MPNERLPTAGVEAHEWVVEVDDVHLGEVTLRMVVQGLVEEDTVYLGETSSDVVRQCLVSLRCKPDRIARRILCLAEVAHTLRRQCQGEEVCILDKLHTLTWYRTSSSTDC